MVNERQVYKARRKSIIYTCHGYSLLGGHIHYEAHSPDSPAHSRLGFLGTMGAILNVRISLYGLKTKIEGIRLPPFPFYTFTEL